MAFQLKKLESGDRFKFSKSLGLDKIRIELTFSGEDLDVQAWELNADGLIINEAAFVFYNSENRTETFDRAKHGNKANYLKETRPLSCDGAVLGPKDEIDGGIETINIDLSKVEPSVEEIAISASVYEEGKTFGSVADARITIYDENTGDALCTYDLDEDFTSDNAIVAGRFVINNDGEWEFEACGKGYQGGLQTLLDMFYEG